MKFIYQPYVPKPSFVLTKTHWISYRFCEWFWMDDLERGLLA